MEFYPGFEFRISFKIFLFVVYYPSAGDNNLTFTNCLTLISHKSTGLEHENGPPQSDTLSSIRNRTWTQHCVILPLELWHLVLVHVILGQHSSLSQTRERFQSLHSHDAWRRPAHLWLFTSCCHKLLQNQIHKHLRYKWNRWTKFLFFFIIKTYTLKSALLDCFRFVFWPFPVKSVTIWKGWLRKIYFIYFIILKTTIACLNNV